MDLSVCDPDVTGLEVREIAGDGAFAARHLAPDDNEARMSAMQRLMRAFVEAPDTILQELVDAAVSMCGADSAGISIEKPDRTDEKHYQWVATAGAYSGFLHAELPMYPSACSTALKRGTPQTFRVTNRFFDLLQVEAPPVTDGLLLPWQVDETRGTIFVMAHQRTKAFDTAHLKTMQMLADFAALAVRQSRLQMRVIEQAKFAAAAGMAHSLAHEINNPLQSLTNVVYLASTGADDRDARTLATDMEPNLTRLSQLVKVLLDVPHGAGN